MKELYVVNRIAIDKSDGGTQHWYSYPIEKHYADKLAERWAKFDYVPRHFECDNNKPNFIVEPDKYDLEVNMRCVVNDDSSLANYSDLVLGGAGEYARLLQERLKFYKNYYDKQQKEAQIGFLDKLKRRVKKIKFVRFLYAFFGQLYMLYKLS